MDVPYKLPLNGEFEMSYAVFKARRGCLVRGIASRESIGPRTLSNGSKPHLANLYERFM
jgi:hypothetical protein